MADGGIVRARPGGTLVRIAEAGWDEALIPLGRNGATGGVTVINQFSVTAVDPDGTRKVVNDYIILAISRNLDTTGTDRGSTMQKALKLKQPGRSESSRQKIGQGWYATIKSSRHLPQ